MLLAGCQQNNAMQPYTIENGEIEASLMEELNAIANSTAAQAMDDTLTSSYLGQSSSDKSASTDPMAFKASSKDQERFDINVNNAEVSDVLMGLVNGTDHNIIVHPSLQGKVSLSLKSVTVDEVMHVIRDIYGYEFRKTPSGYYVMPQQIISHVFHVNYLNFERDGVSKTEVNSGSIREEGGESGSSIETRSKSNLWEDLKVTIESLIGTEDGRSVVVSPQSGMVVVRAMPKEIRNIENYLNKLQANLNRQVIIEAKIVEIELNDRFQSGIDWGAVQLENNKVINASQVGSGSLLNGDKSLASGNGLILPNGTPSLPGSNGSGIPNTSQFQAFGGAFSTSFQSSDFNVFIELLKKQGEVQVLSSPHVSTVNNQKAVIKVGRDEFFVTDVEYQTSTDNNGNDSSGGPNIEFTPFFSGIALDVTPHIDDKNGITLHIHPSVSTVTDDTKSLTVAGENQSIPLALSTVRESDSVIRVESGQLVVLGGLMETAIEDQRAGIPGLSSIPFLGEAFKHRLKTNRKSELVIMLRPIVIESGQDWSKAINRYSRSNRNRAQEF